VAPAETQAQRDPASDTLVSVPWKFRSCYSENLRLFQREWVVAVEDAEKYSRKARVH